MKTVSLSMMPFSDAKQHSGLRTDCRYTIVSGGDGRGVQNFISRMRNEVDPSFSTTEAVRMAAWLSRVRAQNHALRRDQNGSPSYIRRCYSEDNARTVRHSAGRLVASTNGVGCRRPTL